MRSASGAVCVSIAAADSQRIKLCIEFSGGNTLSKPNALMQSTSGAVCVSIAAADSERITLRIEFSGVRRSLQDRNAIHAAKVQSMLPSHAELRFAALEESLADLSEVVRVCDEHEVEFEQFAAFDELLFGQDGVAELNGFEDAHAQLVAEDTFEPGDGLFSTLEGERDGYLHLLCDSAASKHGHCVAAVRPTASRTQVNHATLPSLNSPHRCCLRRPRARVYATRRASTFCFSSVRCPRWAPSVPRGH